MPLYVGFAWTERSVELTGVLDLAATPEETRRQIGLIANLRVRTRRTRVHIGMENLVQVCPRTMVILLAHLRRLREEGGVLSGTYPADKTQALGMLYEAGFEELLQIDKQITNAAADVSLLRFTWGTTRDPLSPEILDPLNEFFERFATEDGLVVERLKSAVVELIGNSHEHAFDPAKDGSAGRPVRDAIERIRRPPHFFAFIIGPGLGYPPQVVVADLGYGIPETVRAHLHNEVEQRGGHPDHEKRQGILRALARRLQRPTNNLLTWLRNLTDEVCIRYAAYGQLLSRKEEGRNTGLPTLRQRVSEGLFASLNIVSGRGCLTTNSKGDVQTCTRLPLQGTVVSIEVEMPES